MPRRHDRNRKARLLGLSYPYRFATGFDSPHRGQTTMDKKIKKKIQALHQRIQKLRQQLAGARKQADDPGEVEALQKQIAEAEAQVAKLKQT